MEDAPGGHVASRESTAQGLLLRIFMLGGFRLLRGERDLHPERWELQRAVSVFKYLVSEEGRWVPSEVLVELFWPEADPERAKGALRTTIHALRHALEPELEAYQPSTYVEAGRGRYRFRTEAPHWWDVRAFTQTLQAARQSMARGELSLAARQLDDALALYRGDFLPEDRYEEWTLLPRERLRTLYLEGAVELGELAGRYPPALPAALARLREAVSIAPEREDVQRQLIALLAASGLVTEALRQYEALKKLLQEEFGVEPSPETEELVNRIRRGPVSRPAPAREPMAAAASESLRDSPQAPPAPAPPADPFSPQRPGALVVEWPTFRRMVHLERRRMQRWKVPVSLLVLTRGGHAPGPAQGAPWEEVEAFFEELYASLPAQPTGQPPAAWQDRAARRLRQGDVVCPVGPRWLLVLLSHADEEAARGVAARLQEVAAHPADEEPAPEEAGPPQAIEVRLVSLTHAA